MKQFNELDKKGYTPEQLEYFKHFQLKKRKRIINFFCGCIGILIAPGCIFLGRSIFHVEETNTQDLHDEISNDEISNELKESLKLRLCNNDPVCNRPLKPFDYW